MKEKLYNIKERLFEIDSSVQSLEDESKRLYSIKHDLMSSYWCTALQVEFGETIVTDGRNEYLVIGFDPVAHSIKDYDNYKPWLIVKRKTHNGWSEMHMTLTKWEFVSERETQPETKKSDPMPNMKFEKAYVLRDKIGDCVQYSLITQHHHLIDHVKVTPEYAESNHKYMVDSFKKAHGSRYNIVVLDEDTTIDKRRFRLQSMVKCFPKYFGSPVWGGDSWFASPERMAKETNYIVYREENDGRTEIAYDVPEEFAHLMAASPDMFRCLLGVYTELCDKIDIIERLCGDEVFEIKEMLPEIRRNLLKAFNITEKV